MMYIVYFVGIYLWLFYGILTKTTPLIIGNSITIMIAGSVLALKLRYG